MNVTVFFQDGGRLGDDEVERALNPNGRARKVGSGTHLPTGERDIEYSYATGRSAEKAKARVRSLARAKRARVRVEMS